MVAVYVREIKVDEDDLEISRYGPYAQILDAHFN